MQRISSLLLLVLVSVVQPRYMGGYNQHHHNNPPKHHYPHYPNGFPQHQEPPQEEHYRQHHCNEFEDFRQRLHEATARVAPYCRHHQPMVHCTIPTVEVLKSCEGEYLGDCAFDIYQRIRYAEHKKCYCGGMKKLVEMGEIVKLLICPPSERSGRGDFFDDFFQNIFNKKENIDRATGGVLTKLASNKIKDNFDKTKFEKIDKKGIKAAKGWFSGDGFIITGGQSNTTNYTGVQIIHANGTMWSTVPCNTTMMANLTLPAARYSHTQTGRIACGGINATANYTDCLVLAESGDGWLNHASLSKSFYQHTSWQSSSLGLVLMGGNITGNNTEVAAARNQPFYLQGNYTLSCAISLSGNAVVLTGGNSTLTNVTEFNSDGLDTSNTHPSLNVGRMNHACGRFLAGGQEVWVVTGGISNDSSVLNSTEVYVQGETAWKLLPDTASLPKPLQGLRGAVINDMMFVTGGMDNSTVPVYSDKIYKLNYDASNNFANTKWNETGTLNNTVANHGMCVLNLREIRNYC